jgi:hypothetical protein
MGHAVGGVGGGNFAIARGSNLQALSIASTGAVTIPQSLAVPSISLNNTDLATTLNSKVDTTSAQTIGGNKTFSSQTDHSGGFSRHQHYTQHYYNSYIGCFRWACASDERWMDPHLPTGDSRGVLFITPARVSDR